mgnify:CR=1 FL=1
MHDQGANLLFTPASDRHEAPLHRIDRAKYSCLTLSKGVERLLESLLPISLRLLKRGVALYAHIPRRLGRPRVMRYKPLLRTQALSSPKGR